jgi:anti-anti-sigma factor
VVVGMIESAFSQLSISVAPTSHRDYACVRIAGDVDMGGHAVFVEALAHLDRLRCRNVCVDLAGINFAGSALLGFLVRVINSVAPGVSVLLCRPGQLTRRLIELSFLDTIATVRDDMPPETAEPPSAESRTYLMPRVATA